MSTTTIVLWIVGSASLVAFHAAAEDQSKQGQLWAPTVIKESLSIPEAELPGLIMRAEAKETDAALKLAAYFGMYLGDTNKQIHYCEIAAGNGSEKALHNLMMIFASFPEFFDFERALQVRARLKAIVAARNGEIDTDNEWGYDMYVEHFVGYGNKPRGLLFLEYAAKHGSRRAAAELARIYSEDPDVADLSKASRWKAVARAQSPYIPSPAFSKSNAAQTIVTAAVIATVVYFIAKHEATERQRQIAETRARQSYARMSTKRKAGLKQKRVRYIAVDTEKSAKSSSKAKRTVMIYDTQTQRIASNSAYDVEKAPSVGSTAKIDTYSAEYVGSGL